MRCATVPPAGVARRVLVLLAAVAAAAPLAAQAPAKRPMTWMDQQWLRSASAPVVSPDGEWALYALSTPDWKEARSQTDLYLVSMTRGLPSTRQLTFTRDRNEGTPRATSPP